MNAPAFRPFRPAAAPRRLRILCAEDNLQLGDVLVHLLSRRGHAVRHASNGRIAWELLARDVGAFDLVLTDNQMPELGGIDLVARLRQASFAGRIVVYSSALDDCDHERYQLLGVDQFVEKSAIASQLLAAVEGR